MKVRRELVNLLMTSYEAQHVWNMFRIFREIHRRDLCEKINAGRNLVKLKFGTQITVWRPTMEPLAQTMRPINTASGQDHTMTIKAVGLEDEQNHLPCVTVSFPVFCAPVTLMRV
ncbi:Nacht, Lrr And Pyd Domains-Containing Protein 11 [Manis pentadactyla]|nr:Nacht, Lrr And Pyd Domains-Containing Protein 11 [Manis pentadactyla]